MQHVNRSLHGEPPGSLFFAAKDSEGAGVGKVLPARETCHGPPESILPAFSTIPLMAWLPAALSSKQTNWRAGRDIPAIPANRARQSKKLHSTVIPPR